MGREAIKIKSYKPGELVISLPAEMRSRPEPCTREHVLISYNCIGIVDAIIERLRAK